MSGAEPAKTASRAGADTPSDAEDRRYQVASRRIILVRHGHYVREGGLGDKVWGLSPLGHRQAIRTGRRLARVVDPTSEGFEGIYTSPWPRASQTAEAVARELDIGTIRVKSYLHELVPLIDAQSIAGLSTPLRPTTEDDERDVHRKLERVRKRFFRRPRTPSTVIVFTHGNLIRYLTVRALGLPYKAWTALDIAHCGITELRLFASGMEVLVSFNDTGHLPPAMITNA